LSGGRGSIDVIEVDRRSVRVTGWALQVDTSTSMMVQCFIDGTPVQQAIAAQPRSDLAPVFPGLGVNHGFDVRFDAPPGVHTVSVQAFPQTSAIDRFEVGNRVIGVGVPFGSLDVVGQVPGGVRVAGWVIDPDADGPSPVHVYVDNGFAAATVADRERPDIAQAFPGAGATHGFDVVVPAAPGARNMCAYAINIDETGKVDPSLNRVLGCRSVEVAGRPFGNVDVAESAPGGVRVAGWAIDPETVDSLVVHVYIDGAIAGVSKADHDRPDIANAYPLHGTAHGFDVVVPALPGRRNICVYAIDAGSGTSGNPILGCRTVAVASAPFGSYEAVVREGDSVRVTGWAIDPGTADPIDVHVHVDGVPVAVGRADLARPDVAAANAPFGADHGFDLTVSVAPGSRQMCVYAIGTAPGVHTLLGCKTSS
jgi:hypothetical protein